MTREEAIRWLNQIKRRYIFGGDEGFDAGRKEAIDMAIEALSADVVQGFRGGKIPQNENILIHKAVAKAFEEGREKASDSYEDMIESTSQENIQLHERINALQTELEKSRKMYEELYEENEYIKDNMRRWIADMKGKING